MYCVEGAVTVRANPETLLGQYGFNYDSTQDPSWDDILTVQSQALSQDEQAVRHSLSFEQAMYGVPTDVEVEQITTAEQAEKYLRDRKGKVSVEVPKMPEMTDIFERLLGPRDLRLVAAEMAVWNETRWPFNRRYVKAEGKLLALLDFDVEQGWHKSVLAFEGIRTTSGLVIPSYDGGRTFGRYETVGKDRTTGRMAMGRVRSRPAPAGRREPDSFERGLKLD